ALTIDQVITTGTGSNADNRGDVRLTAAGDIIQGTTGNDTTGVARNGVILAGQLGVRTTVGNVNLALDRIGGGLVSNNVDTIAAASSAVGSYVKYRDADSLTIDTVAADGSLFALATGVTTTNGGASTNGAFSATGNDITLVSGGALVINQAVNAGTATVRLASDGGISQSVAGIITANSLGLRNATAGNIDLTVASTPTVNNVATIAAVNSAASGLVRYEDADDFAVGSVTADPTSAALFAAVSGIVPNDAPALDINAGLTVTEGSTGTINTTVLRYTDTNNSDKQLVYTVVAAPTHGILKNGATTLSAGGTFTQADLAAGLVTYVHDGSEASTDSFNFSVADWAAPAVTGTFQLTIAQTNDAPTIDPQDFIIYAKSKAGTVVGTVTAGDVDPGQTKSFAIMSGTGAFAINAQTGVLTVLNTKLLVGTSISFTVRVTDNGSPALWDETTVTVALRKTNTPPELSLLDGSGANVAIVKNKATLTIDENAPGSTTQNGLLIGTVTAADFDQPGAAISVSMSDGSRSFTYNAATGEVWLVNASKLDYEARRSLTLQFTATDNGLIGRANTAKSTLTLTIKLNDVNEAPRITSPFVFRINENNAANQTVGIIRSSDPDRSSPFNFHTYMIVSQQDASGAPVTVFSIDGLTGRITVPGAKALDYEAQSFYTLTVRVFDACGLTSDQVLSVQIVDRKG
ncbi:MAG: hypothetical protein C0483_16780, partial [Pirellula sp.]|nr:hypothetical protein [Pirellula sp.]